MERLVFGRFELRPAERLLLSAGLPVPVGARAFDVLVALAARRERVVSKDELLKIVWPTMVVEENNLTVQVSALRKLLPPGTITTVPGRGYQFTGNAQAPLLDRDPIPRRGNVPAVLPPLFGRETDLEAVGAALERSAVVTLCGAGGMGKTSLASALAQRLADRYAGGAWIVELAAVRDPQGVPGAVAQTLGVPLPGQSTALTELLRATRDGEFLLVLDNCEHLLGGVAPMVHALARGAPGLHILVTSQEPLHVDSEQIYRLAPLSVPWDDQLATALEHGAVQLFVERVRALQSEFSPDPDALTTIVRICRHLDGIALAIELAAARVPLLGLAGVEARLGERLRTLGGGVRTPARRHQTLRAALDWSVHLLPTDTQRVLRRLGVFHDGFRADAALAVTAEPAPAPDGDGESVGDGNGDGCGGGGGQEDEGWMLEQLDVLLDRSLLVVARQGARPRYRMLETMREYALDCLRSCGELEAMQRRHAHTLRRIVRHAAKERDSNRQLEEVADIRAALAYTIATPGEGTVALALATDSTVVLATSGLVPEVLRNLMSVERFVAPDTPTPLAAQYWQWVGRVGKDGRLPIARCIEALTRAETMFEQLGRVRRVHACRRHLAEAHLMQLDLAAAEQALARARQAESRDTPAADLMRRLRTEGLLAHAHGDIDGALTLIAEALRIAERYGYRRYRYSLLSDQAWMQLQAGEPEVAEKGLIELLARIPPGPQDGLPRAEALAALLAARIAAGRLDGACELVPEALEAFVACGLLFHRGDIFAWLAAALGKYPLAAQVMGAVDEFHLRTEGMRDRHATHARDAATVAMGTRFPPAEQLIWVADGQQLGEAQLVGLLRGTLTPHPSTEVGR